MATQTDNQTAPTQRPRYIVQMRANWWDTWRTVHYLTPVRWTDCVAPKMPSAEFIWDVGAIRRADFAPEDEFQDFGWMPDAAQIDHAFMAGRLDGRYVRICVPTPPTRESTRAELAQLWIGIIVADGQSRYGYPGFGTEQERPYGVQTIQAYGLAHRLNIEPIRKAYVVNRHVIYNGYVEVPIEDAIAEIAWAPAFNRTYGRGGSEGNMAAPYLQGAQFDLPSSDPARIESMLSCFSDDGGPDPTNGTWPSYIYGSKVWNDEQKVHYLLFFHQPDGNANWDLEGDALPDSDKIPLQFHTVTADLLYGRGIVTEIEGRTVWQILCELASEELGLTFKVVCDTAADSTAQPEVRFTSRFDEDITAGSRVIPGNTDTVDMDVSGSRGVAQCVIEQTHRQEYERVRAVGERLVACFSLSGADATLAMIRDAEESTYRFGAKYMRDGTLNPDYDGYTASLKAALNDAAREDDIFRGVFCRFRLVDNWEGVAGGGDGDEGKLVPVLLACSGVGLIAHYPMGTGVRHDWTHRRQFMRRLPLLEGVDYSDASAWEYNAQNQPVKVPGVMPASPPGTPYRPMMAFVHSDSSATGSSWFMAEAREIGATLSLVDDNRTIEVRMEPKHRLARGLWNVTGTEPTAVDPDEVGQGHDWVNDLIVTVACEMDGCLFSEAYVPGQSSGRELVIPVAGAQAHWVAPNTVVGIDSDGSLLRVPPEETPNSAIWARGVIRNDQPALEAIAKFAAAWLAPARYNVIVVARGSGVSGLGPYGGVRAGQILRQLDPGAYYDANKLDARSMITQVVYDNGGPEVVVSMFTGAASVDPVVVAQRGLA